MLKHIIILISLIALTLQASNFRDGMRAYQQEDYSKAKDLFEISLSKDKVMHASYMLGRIYLYGHGTAVDTKKAVQFLTYSFDSGNIPAGCYISEAYMKEGINSALLAEGLVAGLRKKVPHCKKVFTQYKQYSFPAEFHDN